MTDAGLANESSTRPGGPSLAAFVEECIDGRWYTWAMVNYRATIKSLSAAFSRKSLLEIGGGRSPLLSEQEVRDFRTSYTVNDISPAELARCPAWAHRVCFDVAGTAPAANYGRYDLIFSRMVLEHVSSGANLYNNIYRLLCPGGIAINFHPTLYALPFLINYMMPTRLSEMVLDIAGQRFADAEETYPKFPARYSWCGSSARVAGKIRAIGFEEVAIVPFYGHGYFRKIPILGTLSDAAARRFQEGDFRLMSSYAFTLVRKAQAG